MMILKTQPLKHQTEALAKSFDKENFALLMEQGTGKSKVVIDTAVNLFLQKKITALVIVAPNGVHRNWVSEEIPKHLHDSVKTNILLFNSASAKTQREERFRLNFLKNEENTLKILSINADALLTDIGYKLVETILQKHQSLFVVDESGKILKTSKAKKTKRQKALFLLSRLAKYRRILSGTPITKAPLDLYGQFEFLNKAILGFQNYFSFRTYFADIMLMGGAGHQWPKTLGYKNLDKLQNLVAPYSFRVLKKDCLDLPDKVYTKYFYDLTDEQESHYKKLRSDSVTFPGLSENEADLIKAVMDGSATIVNNALTKLLRLRQIVSGWMKLENGTIYPMFLTEHDNPRVKALLEATENIEGKIIIWSCFVDDIEMLKRFFGELAVTYYGKMNYQQKNEALDKFKSDSTIRYFIANQDCGGTGLTINEATTVVYYANDYKLENRLQSEDRCHRIGQDKNVLYIDLIANGTVDEHIARNLREKMQYSTLLDKI